MNLSKIARHKQASEDNGLLELTDPLEKTDFMNMRRVQPAQVPTEKACTASDYERGIDNLIRGLVDLLPRLWTLFDQSWRLLRRPRLKVLIGINGSCHS